MIQHRASAEHVEFVKQLLAPLNSRYVDLSYDEHDEVTANTQAVTHAAFLSYVLVHSSSALSPSPSLSLYVPPSPSPSLPLPSFLPLSRTPSPSRSRSRSPSRPLAPTLAPKLTLAPPHARRMGTAWCSMGQFPWELGRYIGGIEVVKINITLRIYAAKWHVYAGLAILNPRAQEQIHQFAQSASDLFKLMIQSKEDELRARVFAARDFVFGPSSSSSATTSSPSSSADPAAAPAPPPILLSDTALDRFAIGEPPSASAAAALPPNSHLALLAMVDCWHQLRIRPFVHLALAATPVFRFWIGVAEYLFRDEERLEAAVRAAGGEGGQGVAFSSDDAEFVIAARGWSDTVRYGSFDAYKQRFDETRKFFEPRFECVLLLLPPSLSFSARGPLTDPLAPLPSSFSPSHPPRPPLAHRPAFSRSQGEPHRQPRHVCVPRRGAHTTGQARQGRVVACSSLSSATSTLSSTTSRRRALSERLSRSRASLSQPARSLLTCTETKTSFSPRARGLRAP